MNKVINRSILPLLLMVSFGVFNDVYGQASCVEKLRSARTVYDEGRLHEILDVLGKDCLGKKSTLNEEEKSEAYRLLILSYIYQDLPDKADEAMLALLNANPRFKVDPNTDPNELINLYQSFRTDPVFRYGGKVALSGPLVNINNTYTVNNFNDANGTYGVNLSFTFSGFIEKDFFDKKLTLRAEPHLSLYKMTYNATGFPQEEDPDIMTTTWETIENQSWLGLNILARYGILDNWEFGKKIKPHLILGPSLQFLTKSSLSATTGVEGDAGATGKDIDLINDQIRKSINLSTVVGIGFILPRKKMAFIADITYNYGLINITDKHTSPELTYKYGLVMSDMNLSSINISVGVMLDQYNPKKLTH